MIMIISQGPIVYILYILFHLIFIITNNLEESYLSYFMDGKTEAQSTRSFS